MQCSPLQQPLGLEINLVKDTSLGYEVTKLSNGVTVMTERQPFPTMVDLGVLVATGSRDEAPEQSGSLLAIKQNFLKTKDSQDGLLNLEYLYQSGGYLDMNYDQENTYFKGTFLPENLEHNLDLMIKTSLQRKTDHVDMALVQQAVEEEPYTLTDLLQKQAFGGEFCNLGMPVLGIRDGG